MNIQLLTALGIDDKLELKKILTALEDKQFEYLERLETVSDEARKQELTEVLKQIDEEIQSVKEQIKAVSSSVILDVPEEKTEDSAKQKVITEQKVEKKEEKKQEPDISGKVEKMKEKEAEKKAKEESKKKKAAEEAAKKQQTNNASNASSAPSSVKAHPNAVQVKEVSNNASDFLNGLIEFNNQNYSSAFKVFKELSENGDASSQYLVSIMYLNGLGVAADTDRALFWLEKSADSGETAGQYMYGAVLLSGHNGDQKLIAKGFKNLGAAADKDDEDSMLKYIDAALNRLGGKKEIKKAIMYCEKLKASSQDSFNKQKLEEAKQKLIQLKKGGSSNTTTTSSSANANTYSYKKKRKFPWWLLIIIIIIFWVVNKNNDGRLTDALIDNVTNSSEDILEQIETNEEQGNNEETLMKVRITAAKGNIRDGVGTEAKVINTVNSGTEFLFTGNTGTASNGRIWYEIYLDEERENVGWISESIMEIIEE